MILCTEKSQNYNFSLFLAKNIPSFWSEAIKTDYIRKDMIICLH